MNGSKSITCYNCNTVILKLSDKELNKLNGLNFECDCCGHTNQLSGNLFKKSIIVKDPYRPVYTCESILGY